MSLNGYRKQEEREMSNLNQIGANDFNFTSQVTKVGVTDEFTVCLCCGKENLKKTIVLKDDEGNFTFVGSDCATKLLGSRKASKILKTNNNKVKLLTFSNGFEFTVAIACGCIQEVYTSTGHLGSCLGLKRLIEDTQEYTELLPLL